MMLGPYSYALVATLAGVAYPLFQSFKALKAGTAPDWLPYWLIFVLFSTLPFDFLFSAWVPLWYELKVAFIVALQPDVMNLAKSLYEQQLEPALVQLDLKLANDDNVAALRDGWEKFRNMSMQQKWQNIKDLNLTVYVQKAQAFINKPSAQPSAQPSVSGGDASVDLASAPPPETPPSPDHRSGGASSGGSEDAELVDPPEEPLPAAAKKAQ